MSDGEIDDLNRRYGIAKQEAEIAHREFLRCKSVAEDIKAKITALQAKSAADHPLEGKIVWREDSKRAGGTEWRPTYKKVIVRGVVETYRDQNLEMTGLYHVDIGAPLVRILKADGTPGKKLRRYDFGNWTTEETK